MNPVKNYVCGAAVTAYSIVKFGAADGVVLLGAAETDQLCGITGIMPGESGGRVDVTHYGFGEVKLASAITRGELITSNAAGLAVKLTDAMLAAGHATSIAMAFASGSIGDIIPVFVVRQKVSKVDEFTASTAEVNVLDGAPMKAMFVIGAEAANVINVGIQLQNADNADLAVRGNVFAYLSDDVNGDSIVAVAPDGGVAIGTDGLAIPTVASKAWHLTSEADGDIDLNITHAAGVKTCYLILRMSNGKLVASTAITFA